MMSGYVVFVSGHHGQSQKLKYHRNEQEPARDNPFLEYCYLFLLGAPSIFPKPVLVNQQLKSIQGLKVSTN